jgi:predicted transcriptional regulator of viral defense system
MWKTSPDVRGSSARTLIFKAEKRGLVTRLRPGLYNLVPFELGRATEYIGDLYVIAKELCAGHPYFLLHASRWNCSVWSPSRNSQFTSARHFAKPPQHIHGHEYRFVAVKPEQFFGLTEVWVTKQQPIKVRLVTRSEASSTDCDSPNMPAAFPTLPKHSG